MLASGCFAFDFFDLLFLCFASAVLSTLVDAVDAAAGVLADDFAAGAVVLAALPVVADVPLAGADLVAVEGVADAPLAGAVFVVVVVDVELPAGVVEDCANAVAANALTIRAVTSLLMFFPCVVGDTIDVSVPLTCPWLRG